MTYLLAIIYFSLIRVLCRKKKKLTLTFLHCLGQETPLNNSWKLVYINQISFRWENSKLFQVTSKYFSIFINKPPASWAAHITRNFVTCYFCLYKSSTSTISTLVRELSSCYDYFFRISGFLDLFDEVFLINVKFS